ncbi:MAG: hypothetical protein WAL26_07600 [Mycobacterium sp.]
MLSIVIVAPVAAGLSLAAALEVAASVVWVVPLDPPHAVASAAMTMKAAHREQIFFI